MRSLVNKYFIWEEKWQFSQNRVFGQKVITPSVRTTHIYLSIKTRKALPKLALLVLVYYTLIHRQLSTSEEPEESWKNLKQRITIYTFQTVNSFDVDISIISSGGSRRAPPPYGPKFSQLYAVFRKTW